MSTSDAKVETPVTLRDAMVATPVTLALRAVNSSNTKSSETNKSPPTNRSPPVVVMPPEEARVVIPTTFSVSEILVVSNSVRPSTSKFELISTAEAKVDRPDTLMLSTSRCPSISTSPFKSSVPAKVAIPLMLTSSSSV